MKATIFLPVFLFLFGSSSLFSQVCDNRSLDFDGANDYVQAPSPLTGLGDFTFEAWFKSESSASGSCLSNLSNFQWLVSWDDNNFGIGDCGGNLRVVFAPACSPCTSTATIPLNDGNWHHVAFVKGAAGGSVIYADGNYLTNFSGGNYDLSGFFRLGRDGVGNTGNRWNGKIDEVRIWNYARTAQEIEGSYNCPLTGDEPGLVTYYNFDQGIPEGDNQTVTTLIDLTPNNNNGTLNNFSLSSSGGDNSNWACSGFIPGNCGSIGLVKTVKDLKSNPITTIPAGQPFIYTIQFAVNEDLSTFKIEDQIDPALQILNVSINSMPSAMAGPNCSNTYFKTISNNLVTIEKVFQSGQISCAGESGEIKITVRFPPAQLCTNPPSVTNEAIATGTRVADLATVSAAAMAPPVTPLLNTAFKITKEHGGGNAVNGDISYTILVEKENGTNAYLDFFSLTEELPLGATISSCQGTNAIFGQVIGCTQTSTNPNMWQINFSNTKWNASDPLLIKFGVIVTVKYPSPVFNTGDVVTNTATFEGKVCGVSLAPISASENVTLTGIASTGKLIKTREVNQYSDDLVPGCGGRYVLQFNNGDNIQSVNLVDCLPPEVKITSLQWVAPSVKDNPSNTTVGQICYDYVQGGNTLTCANSPSLPIILKQNQQYPQIDIDPDHWITNLYIDYYDLLPGFSAGYIMVNYCIQDADIAGNPVVVGNTVTNCFKSITPPGLQEACVDFDIGEPTVQVIPFMKLIKDNKQLYAPGEKVTYQLFVESAGAVDAHNVKITDNLDPNLQYCPGAEKYWLVPSKDFGFANMPSSTLPMVNATDGLENYLSSLSVVQSNSNTPEWNVSDMPAFCKHPYWLVIEFQAEVRTDIGIPAGTQICNNFAISINGNQTGVSNKVCITTLEPIANLEAQKKIIQPAGSQVQPGGSVTYNLNLTNTGFVPVKDIVMVDYLPYAGDVFINNGGARGSDCDATFVSVTPPVGCTVSFEDNVDLDLTNELGIAGNMTPIWSGSPTSPTKTLLVECPGLTLTPGNTLTVPVTVTAPLLASGLDSCHICNAFAYRARRNDNNDLLLPAETAASCLSVKADTACVCGEFTDISVLNDFGLPLSLDCGAGVTGNCKTDFLLSANFTCSGPCSARIDWELKDGNNVLISFGSSLGALTQNFNFLNPGSYKLTLIGLCGENECSRCDIFFEIECPCECTPAPVIIVQDDSGSHSVVCGETLDISECSQPVTVFASDFCLYDCESEVILTVTRPNGTPENYSGPIFLLNFTEPGLYTLVFSPNCNGIACEECRIYFNVETDMMPPVAVCYPDLAIVLDNTCMASILPFTVDGGSFDNCGICQMTLSQSQFGANEACQTIQVRLTVIDCAGNLDFCHTNVNVLDNTDPEINFCPPPIAVDCGNIPAPFPVTGTDNCDANLTLQYLESQTPGCPYGITRQWTLFDDCGNHATCIQVLTVTDVLSPEITCPPNTTVILGASTNPMETGEATAIDNCDMNPVLTYFDVTTGTGPCPLTITRTWKATDECGIEATCVQLIAVDCECGCVMFQDIKIVNRQISGYSKPLICGNQDPTPIICPTSGKPHHITGKLACSNNCQSGAISWKVTYQPTGTMVATGTNKGPFFVIPLENTKLTAAGAYIVSLTGICNGDTCTCEIKLSVPAPCTSTCSCSEEWKSGFIEAYNTFNCKVEFTPYRLTECDMVTWKIDSIEGGPLHTVGTTTANGRFVYTFPSDGTYRVCMIVKRTLPNGTICEKTYCKTKSIFCPIVGPCLSPITQNPGFSEGATAGVLGQEGNVDHWQKQAGTPEVVVSAGCLDDNFIKFRGSGSKWDIIDQLVLIESGKQYRARFCFKADSNELQPLTEFVVRLSKQDQLFGDSCIGNCVETGRWGPPETMETDWQHVELEFIGDEIVGDDVHLTIHLENILAYDDPEALSVMMLDNICLEVFDWVLAAKETQPVTFGLIIFPNPTGSSITLAFQSPPTVDLSLHLHDLWGRTIEHRKLPRGEAQHTLDLSTLPPAVYFIEVKDEAGNAVRRKVVKQ